MKANQFINVICQNEDCQRQFTVVDSQYEVVKLMNLDLAVCPWCQQPRTHNFYRRDVKQCQSCTRWKYLWAFQGESGGRKWMNSECVTCRQGKADAKYKHRAIDKQS